jgi:hypothetical protein
MEGKRAIAVSLMSIALIAILVGCGGGSGASGPSTGTTAGPSGTTTSAASASQPSAAFVKPGEEGRIPAFGNEANAAERDAASQVLEESLRARAAGEWAKQCSTLSERPIKELAGNAELQGKKSVGCVKDLEFEAEPLSETKAIRANTMTGPIYAFRISGDHAYALYHGTQGKTYAMAMVKVDGEWKVNNLVTTEIPGS